MSDEKTYGGLTAYEIRHEHPFGCAHDRGIAIALLDDVATLTAENAALKARDAHRENVLRLAPGETAHALNDEWFRLAGSKESVAHFQAFYDRAIAAEQQLAQLSAAEPVAVSDKAMSALRRFNECCEDSDSGGHDVPKAMMRALESIGAVRSCGFGRHETTDFGDWLLGNYTAPPQHAAEPTKTRNYCCCGECGTAGYYDSAEPAEQHAARVPDSYIPIPKALTEPMRDVLLAMLTNCHSVDDSYADLLAAAPTPPAQEG